MNLTICSPWFKIMQLGTYSCIQKVNMPMNKIDFMWEWLCHIVLTVIWYILALRDEKQLESGSQIYNLGRTHQYMYMQVGQRTHIPCYLGLKRIAQCKQTLFNTLSRKTTQDSIYVYVNTRTFKLLFQGIPQIHVCCHQYKP